MSDSCCCTAETNTTLKSSYCSVPKSCPTLCDPMNCCTPGFPALHHLPEFAQTPIHWVSNAIQQPHPLSPPTPLALNLSQHQSLFQRVFSKASASASALPMNIQGWLPLGLTGLISLLSKEFSKVFSSTTVKSINSSVLSLLYGPTLTSVYYYLKNLSFDCMDLCQQSNYNSIKEKKSQLS